MQPSQGGKWLPQSVDIVSMVSNVVLQAPLILVAAANSPAQLPNYREEDYEEAPWLVKAIRLGGGALMQNLIKQVLLVDSAVSTPPSR